MIPHAALVILREISRYILKYYPIFSILYEKTITYGLAYSIKGENVPQHA